MQAILTAYIGARTEAMPIAAALWQNARTTASSTITSPNILRAVSICTALNKTANSSS